MTNNRQPSLFHAEQDGLLGLVMDHRRLLTALETGWIHPPAGSTGHLLRHGGYVAEAAASASSHPIRIRLRLRIDKLPDLAIHIFRDAQWITGHLRDLLCADGLFWPGALPTFAISALRVPTDEEKARLLGMARAVSNVDLSDLPIEVVGEFEDGKFDVAPPVEATNGLVVPDAEDAIRGAITMAMWAVPRIAPWLDLLQATLSPNGLAPANAAEAVDAPWWRFVPWRSHGEPPCSLDDLLWLGAIRTFQTECREDSCRPRELAARVADRASENDFPGQAAAIASWREETNRILRAEAAIRFQNWRQSPTGLAILLVLIRSEPTAFKTWFKDEPNLPPAVAWSAATLCGLRNGYRRLDTRFRGCAEQREFVAIAALTAASPTSAGVRWPNGSLDLRWRREPSGVVFSHDGRDFAPKTEHARGLWYAANFGDSKVRSAAVTLAKELRWPCIAHEAVWEAKPPFSEPLAVAKKARIERGKVRMPMPPDAAFEPIIDAERFRCLVATESAAIPEPPSSAMPSEGAHPLVPGLTYLPNFLTEDEERKLVATIDAQPWSHELQRRVQHYGWRYNYKSRQIDPSMQMGPLPLWAEKLAFRLFDRKLVPHMPDQVIINEYEGKQGITKHVDAEGSFADGIAMVSLADAWEMTFRDKRNRRRKVDQLLERRSVAVIQGDARYGWTHEIPSRKSEPPLGNGGKRRPRQRRISLTFRKVIAGPD